MKNAYHTPGRLPVARPLRQSCRQLPATALLLMASLGATGGLAAFGLILRLYPPA